MRLRPVQDEVLVKLDPFEKEFGDSGIVRPDIAYDKQMWGTVRGVGKGYRDKKGRFIPTTLKIGQRVYCPWVTGHDLDINGEPHLKIRERKILAVEEGS